VPPQVLQGGIQSTLKGKGLNRDLLNLGQCGRRCGSSVGRCGSSVGRRGSSVGRCGSSVVRAPDHGYKGPGFKSRHLLRLGLLAKSCNPATGGPVVEFLVTLDKL
jgi:hypothetical protein